MDHFITYILKWILNLFTTIFFQNNKTICHKTDFLNLLLRWQVPHPEHCQHVAQVWEQWCYTLNGEMVSWWESQDKTYPYCFHHLSFDLFHWWLVAKMSVRKCCQLQYIKQKKIKYKPYKLKTTSSQELHAAILKPTCNTHHMAQYFFYMSYGAAT